MYSKIAGDMSLPNIDRTRNATLRMDRFMALAKLDVQLMALLLLVGVINGINPGGSSYLPSLLVSSTVGVVAMAIWLTLCCIAVTYGKPRMALFAEFSHPFSYIVAAAYMFSSVYYGDMLMQIHGQAYLLAFPILFLIGRTFVWWDARLLSGSDLAIMHRDLYGKLPGNINRGHLISISTEKRFGKGDAAVANLKDGDGRRPGQKSPKLPSGLLPLIRGAWLLKLPSSDLGYGKGGYRSFNRLFNVQPRGKWRFFQLSHDGSTLRWDWRKYVLLMHVESVHACTEDLTITLKFTLEPDLRLKCKDATTHAAWARGLTLIVMMLGNPDGLEGDETIRENMNKKLGSLQNQPPSPSKLLHRLTSGSLRASAAGLLTKDTLRLAAFKARKAFSDQSQNSSDEEKIDLKSDECMSSYKPIDEDGTPTKTFNIHASAEMIHRRRCTPVSLQGNKVRSPFQPDPLNDRHSLARSESVHVDIETGLNKPLQESPGDGIDAPRSASFTAVDRSPKKTLGSHRYDKGLVLEGWRSSFSKGNPHRFLDRGNSYSPNSENGAHQPAVNQRGSSPLRRVGKMEAHQYTKRDSYDTAQFAPHSDAWQQKFDAGMASMDGSTDGSPSVLATPRSSTYGMPRTVSVNVEIIDFSHLSFGKMLGRGAEGPVYAAWYQETPVAVKRASCQTELDVHLHAGWHDNVVNLRGLAHNGGHSYLVMELCPRGTLDMLIHKGSAATIDPNKLLPIARSIARGMLHLHRRLPPIFHRDLKPGNIFIGHGFVMKIGDFGMARYAVERGQPMEDCDTNYTSMLDRTLTPGVIGTAAYSAPELLNPSSPRSSDISDPSMMLKADVYSFGVILWELLERKRPFADMDGFQIQTQWIINPEQMRFKAPDIPPNLDPASRRAMATLCELVTMCTSWNPTDRPDFHVILGKIKDAISRDSSTSNALPTVTSAHLVSPFCG